MNAKVAGIFLLLVALCAFLSIYTPESFLKGNNIENLIRRTSMYGILGIGVAFVIITGGIDLSIGSLVCLSACLLAMFLDVQYVPYDGSTVRTVTAQSNTIEIDGKIEGLKQGDRIRFYGAKRARSGIFTLKEIRVGTTTSEIFVEEEIGRDDATGKVAKLYPIRIGANQTDPLNPEVTIDHPSSSVAARDQVWFVGEGLKQMTVTGSFGGKEGTTLSLNESPRGVDESWYAVPLERQQRFSIPTALVLVLGISVVLGVIHGVLVTKLSLQPFVVTLCGLLIYRGATRWLVDDRTMGFGTEYSESLASLSTGKLSIWSAADGSQSFGIPSPFFVMLGCAVLASLFLNKTVGGRYMLALGRNEEAARYSGINTGRMTLLAYVICAVMAAIGGVLFALDSNSVAPSSFGNFFELYAIAAAVLGGCSLRGGEGGIFGVVVGTALMQTLYNLIVLVGISDKLEFAIIGAVILGGVVVDEVVRRTASRHRATTT